MKDKEKMLRLMRFWLFGAFLIFTVAMVVYIGGALGTGLLIFGQVRFWITVIVIAVLCVVWYYLYKWFLEKNS